MTLVILLTMDAPQQNMMELDPARAVTFYPLSPLLHTTESHYTESQW